MTDKGICIEIGHRIRTLRLRKNLTQQQVANMAALSLNAVKSVESGKGRLMTLIAVLRELGALETLDRFIPEPSISPMQLARQHGKQRQRASGKRLKDEAKEEAEW